MSICAQSYCMIEILIITQTSTGGHFSDSHSLVTGSKKSNKSYSTHTLSGQEFGKKMPPSCQKVCPLGYPSPSTMQRNATQTRLPASLSRLTGAPLPASPHIPYHQQTLSFSRYLFIQCCHRKQSFPFRDRFEKEAFTAWMKRLYFRCD